MLRLAFDFIITWRETRTRPNAYEKRIVIYKFMCRRMCDDVCTADAWAVTKGEGGYSGL